MEDLALSPAYSNDQLWKAVLLLTLTLTVLLTTTILLRLLLILPALQAPPPKSLQPQPSAPRAARTSPPHLLIVLGSGGHTTEMLSMLRALPSARYPRRTYIISSGDAFSAGKARAFEEALALREELQLQSPSRQPQSESENFATPTSTLYEIHTVPRARAIHQRLLTTPLTSLHSLLSTVRLLSSLSTPPDIVLTNGPATGVIVILGVLILKFFGVWKRTGARTVFVESWARVRTLSLSGKVLWGGGLVDRFLVQWEGLAGAGRECRGFLVG